jgi:hypothetical protein
MKTKYISILLFGLLTVCMMSCEDSLDIAKHGDLGTMDDFYQTDEQATEAASAVYASWYAIYAYRDDHTGYFLKELLADDSWCGGNGRGNGLEMEDLNEYKFGIENSHIESYYTKLYTLIYRANLVLERVHPDSDVKKRAIAEARFFRAWAHFDLVTLWGIAPAVDHVLGPSEYRQPAGDPATTWALIEEDLTAAVNSGGLPSKTGLDDKTTGMCITKETALSYLGKAYLFQEKWNDAAETLDKVIGSGLYDLYGGEYGDVLKLAANNGRESILELQASVPIDMGMMMIAMERFTQIHAYVGWRGDKFVETDKNPDYEDLGTDSRWGYGNFCPKKSLYDAFVAREGVDGYRLNQTMKTWDFLRDEVRVSLNAQMYGNEGYFMWKNRFLKSELFMPILPFCQEVNISVMRYAEVLLLAAEAHLRNGNASKATEYVNKIRTRAKLANLGTVTMDDIKIEKRLELCLENVRYQDLIRWGDAPSVLGGQGEKIPVLNTDGTVEYPFTNSTYGFKSGKHELLPIPGKEMMVNDNMSQNPGW